MIVNGQNLMACEGQSDESAIYEAMEFIDDFMGINKFYRNIRMITVNGKTNTQKMTFFKNSERCSINIKVTNKICLFRISIHRKIDKKDSKIVLRSPWLSYSELTNSILRDNFRTKLNLLNTTLFHVNINQLMKKRGADRIVMSFIGKEHRSMISFPYTSETKTQDNETPNQ